MLGVLLWGPDVNVNTRRYGGHAPTAGQAVIATTLVSTVPRYGNEERLERLPANPTLEDWKTQPAQGDTAMAVRDLRLPLSC